MVTSAEPGKKSINSDDLRWRVVRLKLTRELYYRQVCASLGPVRNVWR